MVAAHLLTAQKHAHLTMQRILHVDEMNVRLSRKLREAVLAVRYRDLHRHSMTGDFYREAVAALRTVIV